MLIIEFPEQQFIVEGTDEIVTLPSKTYKFELSLLTIAKWESKHEKPYNREGENNVFTDEESLDLVQCMCVDPTFEVARLTDKSINKILEYTQRSQTATIVTPKDAPEKSSIPMTSEVIYGYMTLYRIPYECQKWPLSRLMTLIQVMGELSKDPNDTKKTKLTAQDIEDRKALNAKRLVEMEAENDED